MTRSTSKKSTKFFAIFMAVVLLAMCIPTNVFGTSNELPHQNATETQESVISETSIVDGGVTVNTDIIGEYVEDISKREENVKHFANPDGTYTAIVYPTAVHRKDDDGVWQDINNDLALTTVKGSEKYASADSRVSFASRFAPSAELMTLSENGYSISMSLISDSKNDLTLNTENQTFSLASVTNAAKKELPKTDVKLEDVARVDNKSSIIYNNVRANTDIEYILDGNDVKENIIVKAPLSSYEYAFDLRLDGLVAILNENGSIVIYDAETEEAKYQIPAPYMYDASGEISYAVEYTLIEVSSGRYLLMVTADKTWINAEGREFPVTIDPSITYSANVVDTYISFTNEGSSYDGMSELWVGSDNDTYIKMDMPGLPDGATFIDATLFVYYYYHISYGSMLVGAYEPVDDWSESISLNIAPGYNIPAISTSVLSASSSISYSEPGIAGFDVTELAEGWYSDPSSNYGVVLSRINDSQHTNQSVILRAFESWEDCSFISVDYAFDIPEGVYALENVSFYDYWMMVADDSVVPGSSIRYDLLDESPVSTFERSSLFKISEKGNTERYIIRSMLNNRLGIGVVNGELVTKLLPASDDAVPNEDTFHIVWSGYGYHIKPYNTELYISGSDAGVGEDLFLVDKSNAYFNARWNLHRYTTANRSDIVLDVPSDLMAGESFELHAYSWSTFVDCNVVNISVHPESTGLASIEWIDEQNVSLVIHDEGTLKISKTISYPSGTEKISRTPVYNVSLPIEEGTYFIKTTQGDSFLEVNSDTLLLNGSVLFGALDASLDQRWDITHLINGYYKITSVSTGKALSLKNDVTYNAGREIVYEEYDGSLEMQWKISHNNGRYIIRSNPSSSTADYTYDWCMSIVSNSLVQSVYTDNDVNNDEWIMARIGYASTVEREEQEKTNWCWVACARMFAKHYYPTITYTQEDAVVAVMGNDDNVTGNLIDEISAINYYISNIPGASLSTDYEYDFVYSEEVLLQFFDDENVIIMRRGKYVDESDAVTRTGGHAVLLFGYVVINNKNYFLIKDPWMLGDSHFWLSYEELNITTKNNFFGSGNYWVWDGYIALVTDYSSITVPYHYTNN